MARLIKRLLIANRGEIAVRIVRACRELDVESVAVYSDADARAPHVAAADRALRIGAAPAADSYLSVPHLLEAVHSSGADAVHPGYGFLAENAAFAAACERGGVTFVGPTSSVRRTSLPQRVSRWRSTTTSMGASSGRRSEG